MANDLPPADMRDLWQKQDVEPVHMTLDEIRKRSQKFQRKIRMRNGREYAAGVLVVAAAVFYTCVFHDPLMTVGCGLIIAGTLYVAYQIHTRGSARTAPADMAITNSLQFHRRELERQRDLVRNVWSWYLGPLLPGWATVTLAGAIANPGPKPRVWWFTAAYAVLAGVFFFLVGKWNQRAARKLQRQIDALDAMEKQS